MFRPTKKNRTAVERAFYSWRSELYSVTVSQAEDAFITFHPFNDKASHRRIARLIRHLLRLRGLARRYNVTLNGFENLDVWRAAQMKSSAPSV